MSGGTRVLNLEYYIEKEKVYSEGSELCMSEFFAKHTTRAQWAQFFRDHYNLKQMYAPREWTPKRIRYMRKIYNALTKDQPTPFLTKSSFPNFRS